MEFTQSLSDLKGKIEARMGKYIDEKRQTVAEDDFFLAGALSDVESVVLGGGKRLRGALLYHGYRAAGGTNEEAALTAASGMEFIHSYLLIHDDIMDRDSLRHGVETLHKRFEHFALKHFPNKDAEHFGTAIAITLGDMVCAWGNDCIFSVDLPREHIKRAIQKIQDVVHRTGVGQMRDMYIEFAGTASEEEILAMYKDKTAYYTLEAPLQVGLLLGGGNDELATVFQKYALPLGIAFQLQDDLLGLYGDEKHLGKNVGSDIIEGKFTLLIQQTLSALPPADQTELKRVLTLGDAVTPEHIAWVRAATEKTGAKQNIETRIKEYIETAITEIREAPLDESGKEFLLGLAQYMSNRTL